MMDIPQKSQRLLQSMGKSRPWKRKQIATNVVDYLLETPVIEILPSRLLSPLRTVGAGVVNGEGKRSIFILGQIWGAMGWRGVLTF